MMVRLELKALFFWISFAGTGIYARYGAEFKLDDFFFKTIYSKSFETLSEVLR